MLPARGGFGARLLLTQLLIVLVGGATLLLVALALAPGLFRAHVLRAVGPVTPELAEHLDMAFAQAILLALAIAMTTATVTALAIALLVAHRSMGPIEELSRAASSVAAGDYSARVGEHGFGSEIAALAQAFNQMASDLAATERTRAEMLRDLAHELRTPLTTVRGYHEAVADGVLPADRTTFARVETELARIERLVGDLDLVSRAQERRLDLRLRPVAVNALVAAATEAATPAAQAAGVSMQTGADTRCAVLVDPDRLQEALANLVSNALRHTSRGGVVLIESRRTGAAVEITVTDDGAGIAPEHLPRVFERFYRVDDGRARRTGGSGIGLTITRALVEAHGGRVSIASPGTGLGATATIELPVWTPNAPSRDSG